MSISAFTVLIVDPDDDTRQINTVVFEYVGHRALAVATATEGLRLAAALRPDVIVAELGVPPHGGEHFLCCLRADPRTRAIPVIAFTARAMLKDRDWLLACGFEEVVLKPCEPRALAVIVEAVIGLSEQLTESEIALADGPLGRIAKRVETIVGRDVAARSVAAVGD